MRSAKHLTYERVKEAFDYDPLTGEFTWKIPGAQRRRVGDVAGTLDADSGYWLIGLDNAQVYGHQLAYFWTFGSWAKNLDHKNRNRADNRWENLRLSNQSGNTHNQFRDKERLPGAYKDSRSPSWFSSIMLQGRRMYLGVFSSEEEAHLIYALASIFHYGEFSPFFPKENYDSAI